jgi:mono/diheme cytochrome c family protein
VAARLTRGLAPALLAVGLLAATPRPAGAQAQDTSNPFEGNAQAIDEGRELASRKCVFCHGGGLRGAKGPDLTDEKWKFGGTNAALFAMIAGGRPGTQMGGFASSMTGEEIWKVIAYIRSQYRGDPDKNPVKAAARAGASPGAGEQPAEAAAPAPSPQ